MVNRLTGGPIGYGYLSQSLSTIPGYDYNLSISWWVYNGSGDTNIFQASLSGTAIVAQTNQVANGWINLQGNIEFGASVPGSTVLQFAYYSRGHKIALDDIALQWTDVAVQGWFTYTTNNDGTLNITGCNGCGGTLIIPGWINLTPVTSIGNNAFQNYTNLTSVTFAGNSLTSITTNVITLNSSHVTSIGDYAFYGCTSLTNVIIPNSASYIGGSAFWNCTNLDNITMGTNVTAINTGAFGNCFSLTSITLPNSLTTIYGGSVFFNCTGLTNVTLGTGLCSIPGAPYGGMFYGCSSLQSIIIPNTVTNIADGAFQNCTNLTGVYYMGNAPSLGGLNVFLNDSSVTNYYMPGTTGWGTPGITLYGGRPIAVWTVPNWNYTDNNGAILIIGYTGTGGAVTIPATINGLPVTSLGNNAFQNCSSLTGVTIPNSITNIGRYAFQNCIGLTGVTIPSSVININVYAFYGCTNLGSITLPNNLNSIGVALFLGCTSLTNIVIPGSVTSIAYEAFDGCSSLRSITIPASITYIDDYAFHGCTNLSDVDFIGNAPNLGATTVFAGDNYATVYYLPGTTGWNAPTFGGVPAMLLNPPYLCTTANGAITIIGYTGPGGAVTIPDTINSLPVTTISSGVFQNCASLTSVTIPASVTNLADSAFQNCSSLSTVYFLGNAPIPGGPNVFSGDNNAIGYNAAGTTGWGLTFDGLTMVLANNSTINSTNHYAYGANFGWLDWRSDTNHGAVIGTNVCSGYIYSANFGWISLGNGAPVNGLHYQNNSASDFGVNVDGSGNLNGYAYGANIGWITFTNIGAPQVDLASGNMSGSVWSANWGWISLSNTVASVQTAALQQSAPSGKPQLTSISVNGTTLTLKAVNGTASGQYVLLGTTNAAKPLSEWTPLLTNQFDSGGCLNLCTNIINPAAPQEFYILKQ